MYLSHKIEVYPDESTKAFFHGCFCYRIESFNRAFRVWEDLYADNLPRNEWVVRDIVKDTPGAVDPRYPIMVLENAVADLSKAFNKFFKGIGSPPKPIDPNIDRRHSFRISRRNEHAIQFFESAGGWYIKVTKTGKIKIAEKPRFDAPAKEATFIFEDGRYYVGVVFDVGDSQPKVVSDNMRSIGIDAGIKVFGKAAYMDGGEYHFMDFNAPFKDPKNKHLYEKVSRALTQMNGRKKGSKSYNKYNKKYREAHRSIVNIHNDYLHKLTARLVQNFDIITIEDMNVSKMLKTAPSSRVRFSIKESRLFEFRQMLEYKTEIYGKYLVIAPPGFESTQICSACGNVLIGDARLGLRDRTFKCTTCGHEMDRDYNAAINLDVYGRSLICSSFPTSMDNR